MKTKITLPSLAAAVLLSLATGCAPDADEPVDAAEVAAPAAVPDPVDPIDAGEPPIGPDHAAAVGVAGLAEWDTDGDAMLGAEEFRTGFADTEWMGEWDGDDDGFLNEEEFTAASAAWGDAPGGVDTNGLFDLWDADEDGLIDDDELAEGVYGAWDANDDEMIDEMEFEAGEAWFAG